MFGVIEAGKESNINYPQTQDTLRIRVLKANHILPFSDLRASTTLYETIGDAHAYGQVNRHFDFLTDWIAKNSGSIVKTIGDAVMAVFHRPEVISEQCFERKGVQEVIKQYSSSEEVYKTHLKGIAESVVITRIWL